MAWTKTVPVTARAENKNIQIRLSFPPGSSGAASELVFDVWIGSDALEQELHTALLDSSSLSTSEKNDLIAALKKLRDDGLTAKGYSQT